jgi:hypothetical protein
MLPYSELIGFCYYVNDPNKMAQGYNKSTNDILTVREPAPMLFVLLVHTSVRLGVANTILALLSNPVFVYSRKNW